ncbi:Uncharacterized protein DBV15_12228 [Temnothorax longispinosus]|uniref:Uncharacterized protein n=1 Tax=Temnothorax longispinosus TaxID=300112 RepID=A0A4S2KDE9_9HYME|nr:Uncharacterized protein DBV15_12228 [Temnothorax longispinosus]
MTAIVAGCHSFETASFEPPTHESVDYSTFMQMSSQISRATTQDTVLTEICARPREFRGTIRATRRRRDRDKAPGRNLRGIPDRK